MPADGQTLWATTVAEFLKSPLWIPRDMYDAETFLELPLETAFATSDTGLEQQFVAHFDRFLVAPAADVDQVVLDRLTYFYLASRFMVLAASSGQPELVRPALLQMVQAEFDRSWDHEPLQPYRSPTFSGARDYITWKLNTAPIAGYGYLTAITDTDIYLLAIGADLETLHGLGVGSSDANRVDALALAQRVFELRVVWQADGGWLLQPGAWADHPDFLYAGQPVGVLGMAPAPLRDVAEDSSHSIRYPLWLRSFAAAEPRGPDRDYFVRLIAGLATQFRLHVLTPPTSDFPGFRTTNYMDGRNGVYRWNDHPGHPNTGYGPYELSGAYLVGWWGVLGDPTIRDSYRRESELFPIQEPALATYEGPPIDRARHPLIEAAYTNGYRKLLVELAASGCTGAFRS